MNEEELISLASQTLVGDVRDFLLDRVKNFGKPWVAMTENEQRDQVAQAKDAAERLVREVVHVVASEGRVVITANLEKVTVKDTIKAELSLPKSDTFRHELIDSQGQAVLIVVAGVASFQGEKGPADIMPDQLDILAAAEQLKRNGAVVSALR